MLAALSGGWIAAHSLRDGDARTTHARAGAVDDDAHDALLRGRFHLYRQNAADGARAVVELERAVALDPEYAEAYALLGRAYMFQAFTFGARDPEWTRKAFVAAERALALDSMMADAHITRGRLLWMPASRWRHAEALRAFRRAAAIDPRSDDAHYQLGLVYGHIGMLDEAIAESQKAVKLNPQHTAALSNIAQAHNYAGRYAEAAAVLRSVPFEGGQVASHYHRGWALVQLGRPRDALALVDSAMSNREDAVVTNLHAVAALAHAVMGNREEARAAIARATADGRGYGHFHHTAYAVGAAHALLGEPTDAIHWLREAADDGFPCHPLFAGDPHLASLRRDPRFAALLTELERTQKAIMTELR